MRRGVAGIVMALAVAGCAGGEEPGWPSPETTTGDMTVHVENKQWYDMDIYVAGGIGAPQILGTVPGQTRGSFKLPKALLQGASEVWLIADPSGSSQRMTSDPLDVRRGHTVQWQLRKSGLTRLVVM